MSKDNGGQNLFDMGYKNKPDDTFADKAKVAFNPMHVPTTWGGQVYKRTIEQNAREEAAFNERINSFSTASKFPSYSSAPIKIDNTPQRASDLLRRETKRIESERRQVLDLQERAAALQQRLSARQQRHAQAYANLLSAPQMVETILRQPIPSGLPKSKNVLDLLSRGIITIIKWIFSIRG